MSETKYPADRYIRMTDVDGREQPAFAPNQAEDALESYSAFLFNSQEEADREIVGDRADILREVREGERDEDDVPEDDTVLKCTVYEDGTIKTEFTEISRAEIFQAYGMHDEFAPTAPAR